MLWQSHVELLGDFAIPYVYSIGFRAISMKITSCMVMYVSSGGVSTLRIFITLYKENRSKIKIRNIFQIADHHNLVTPPEISNYTASAGGDDVFYFIRDLLLLLSTL